VKIVVLDGCVLNPGDLSWDNLKALGNVTIYDRTSDEEKYDRAKDAEIIITNKVLIDREFISKLPNLKYVGVLATGYNIVDVEEAKKRNIIVTNVPAYSTKAVAQLIFAYILHFYNQVSLHSDSVRNGDWSLCKDFSYWKTQLSELEGKTIGIIGFGSIGRRVANIAAAFDMNVVAYSRTITDQRHREDFKWLSIDRLLRTSDIVTLNCPLTEKTAGLINKESLSKMKKDAILINASRGPVIIEEDLAEALNNNIIAGAALDVLSLEPPKADNPLFKAKNCIITPHIAWATLEARTRLMNVAVENVKMFLEEKPQNVVNS
jgi:glycerate dehydrogenase